MTHDDADRYLYVVEEGEVTRFTTLEDCPPSAYGYDWIIVWARDESDAQRLAGLYDSGQCPDDALPTNKEIGWPDEAST